jgi:hypothetical protein
MWYCMIPLTVEWGMLGIGVALLILGGFVFVWLLGKVFGAGQTA